jgi:hypothetical protein
MRKVTVTAYWSLEHVTTSMISDAVANVQFILSRINVVVFFSHGSSQFLYHSRSPSALALLPDEVVA